VLRGGPVIAHWHTLVDRFDTSALDLYAAAEQAIRAREVTGAQFSRVEFSEGGFGTPKQLYLRVELGWLLDGTYRHLLAFDAEAVEKLSRAEVLRLLIGRGKLTEAVVDNLLSWRQSGFSVHTGAPVESRSEAVRLGRYGIRCPLVLERLSWDETSGEVVYRARAGHRDGRGHSVARWEVLEFLARLLDHVPELGQQLLRSWGCYSNAA